MTALTPGLNPRDSQILQLLRDGAPVRRVIAIGKHRGTWNAVHVGAVVAFHLDRPLDAPLAAPKKNPVRAVPTPEQRTAALRAYKKEWRRRHDAGEPTPLPPEWNPEPFTGRPTIIRLTSARIDVLQQMCRGLSNRRIATELNISEDTVKSHAKDINMALGASDRTHAVVRVWSGQVRILGEPRTRTEAAS